MRQHVCAHRSNRPESRTQVVEMTPGDRDRLVQVTIFPASVFTTDVGNADSRSAFGGADRSRFCQAFAPSGPTHRGAPWRQLRRPIVQALECHKCCEPRSRTRHVHGNVAAIGRPRLLFCATSAATPSRPASQARLPTRRSVNFRNTASPRKRVLGRLFRDGQFSKLSRSLVRTVRHAGRSRISVIVSAGLPRGRRRRALR